MAGKPNPKINAWAKKMKEQDPDYFKKLGSKGGKNSTGYGFAHGKLDPRETAKLRKKLNKEK